jgi:hypothetical protein
MSQPRQAAHVKGTSFSRPQHIADWEGEAFTFVTRMLLPCVAEI